MRWPWQRRETKTNGVDTRSLENPQVSLRDPRALTLIFGGEPSAAGVTVNEQTALGVAAYWCGVNFLSGTMATLPFKTYRRSDDERNEDRSSRLWRILHDAIGGRWSSLAWRKYSMQRILLGGRKYTLIVRNRGGQISRLVPLVPSTVTPRLNGDSTAEYVVRQPNGPQRVYGEMDIIDIPWMLGEDTITHVDPLARLSDALGLSIAMVRYASRFFQNGGVPPTVVEGPFNSPAAAQRAGADIAKAQQKAHKEGRPLVLPDGHVLRTTGVSPKDSQLSEERRFQLEEVARMLNLPPIFLQDLTHGTFSNTEQQDLHLVKHTIAQWAATWEAEVNLKLFNGERDRNRFAEFELDGLLRGDFITRMQGLATGVQHALLTPNEGRKLENRPPKEGGDDLFIQGASVPIRQQLALPLEGEGEPDQEDTGS